jgi:hypothetical protein
MERVAAIAPVVWAEVGGKLPPPTRAAALMALLGIGLLGMLLVVIILLGGHWVRRQGSYRRGPAVPRDRPPLKGEPPEESAIDHAPAGEGQATTETLHDGTTKHGETKAL